MHALFFNDTATTDIYTLSLHDALPISTRSVSVGRRPAITSSSSKSCGAVASERATSSRLDRKSTRLNSSHTVISYAVFCLKKKRAGKFSAEWTGLVSSEIRDNDTFQAE